MSVVDIIKHNLKLMTSEGEGAMFGLIEDESIGASSSMAVDGKKYPCVGVNFFYNGETGEIVCFSNYDSVLEKKFERGTFKMAIDMERQRRDIYFKIVAVSFGARSTRAASKVLEDTVKNYNILLEVRKQGSI